MSQIDIQGFEILSSEPTMDRLDRLEEERKLKELRPGTFVSAFKQESLLHELSRVIERNKIPYDPYWTGSIGHLPQETQDLLLKDLPAGQHTEVLDKSRSYQEAWVIANQLRKINERNLVLQDAGFSGILARIGAAISDPAAIGLGLATGSIGYFGTKSAQAARISYRMKRSLQAVDKIDEFTKSTARLRRVQMVRSGLVGGVTEAGIEAVLSGTDPTRGATDILFAALGGGIMTGAASNIGTRMGARAGQKRIQLADFERWGELGGEMTEKGKRHFAQVSERANARMMDDMIGDHGLPKEETGLFDSVYNKDKKVWALRINGRPVPTDGTGVGMLPFEYSTGKKKLLKLSREEVLGLAGRTVPPTRAATRAATPNTEAFLEETQLGFVSAEWLAQRPRLEEVLGDVQTLSKGVGRAYLDGDLDRYLDDSLRSRFGDTKEKIPKGLKEEIVNRVEELAEQHNIPALADRQAEPNLKAFMSDVQVPTLSADLLREAPGLHDELVGLFRFRLQELGRAYIDGNLESHVNKFVEEVSRKANIEGDVAEKFKSELIRNVEDAAETHNITTPLTAAEPSIAVDYAGGRTTEAALGPHRTVHVSETDPEIAAEANRAHGTKFAPQDAHDVSPDQIRDADLYIASPVCKSLSAAKIGRKVLQTDIDSAEKIASNIREAKPRAVVIENVPAFATKDELMGPITRALDDAGYTWDVQIHDAASHGGAMHRNRMVIRAVRDGDLPPVPPTRTPGDWWEAVKDLVDDAPDAPWGKPGKKRVAAGKTKTWEEERLREQSRLDPDNPNHVTFIKPIITMGGSTNRVTTSAKNAGGPAPTLKATPKEKPRILLPDGRIKEVTPRMMARLMGLPDSFSVPDKKSLAKTIIGNGIHGETTRAFIEPLAQAGASSRQRGPRAAKKVADADIISPDIEDNRIVLDITDLTDDQVVDLFRDTVKKMPDNASGTDFKPDLVSPSYAKSIKGIFGKRFTISGILGNSKDKFVRMYNNITAQDALAKADGTPQSDTASEWTSRNHGSYMGAYNRVANDHFSKWSKAQGTSWSSKFEAKQKFLEEVTRGVRGEAVDEHVMNVVKFQRKMIREIFDIGKRHGVRGLEDVFAGKNYVPRIWSVTKIMKMEDAIGRKGVVKLLRGSLADTHDDFSDELLDKWAEAVFVLIRKGDDYNEIQRSNIISGTDPDLLEDALGKIKGEVGLTDEQIAKIVGQVQEHVTETKKVTKPLTARAMRRIDLNELHEGKDELTGYKISDLFENNSGTLMDIYTKQILGSAAMSRTYHAMELQMKVPIKNLKQLKEALGRSMGREGIDSRQIDRDMAKIETIEKSVMGRRMSPDTAANAFARNLRLAQHIRLMGQLGFANLPELGAALASHGYRVLFQQMPVVKKIWQQSLKGEMSEPLLKEVVAFWNMGLARKNDQVLSRLDVGDAVWNAPGGTGETWMKRGARLVNDISLFAPINIFQQQSAVLVAVQKWANYASEYKRAIAKGVQPKLPGKKRLASMGLTQEDARKILSEMSLRMSEGENVPGFGRRVKQINIDSWRDTAAANKFILAVDRWSNSAVQSPNIGNLANWMTTDFGRVISQFRTFTFVSLEKQLQAKGALFFEDWQTAMEWSHGLLVAGLVYWAQEQILSAGRPDRAEYLKERLSLSRIGRVAFSRSTFASFAPDAFDSISSLLGRDSFLFDGRNSQLPNTYLSLQGAFSNPTSDFANKIIKGLQDLIIEPAMGDGFPTQAELRQASTLLPAYRALGIQNFLNLMIRLSPEQE